MSNLSQEIVNLRNRKKVSLKELSHVVDISQEALREIEQGQRDPSTFELQKIAIYYHMTPEEIIQNSKLKKSRKVYPVLHGYNVYAQRWAWVVLLIPILSFLTFIFLTVPAFQLQVGEITFLQYYFEQGKIGYIILGALTCLSFALSGFYWIVMLGLGKYRRSRRKPLNNIMLAVCGNLTLIMTFTTFFSFQNYRFTAGAIICYIFMLLTAACQIVLLGIFTYIKRRKHEDSYVVYTQGYNGYQKKRWWTLGLTVLSIIAFGLMFTSVYQYGNVIGNSAPTLFEIIANGGAKTIVMGAVILLILSFNWVYWIVICCISSDQRRLTAKANNIILGILGTTLIVVTATFMAYIGTQFLTKTGIALFAMLLVLGVYELFLIPVINSNLQGEKVIDGKSYKKGPESGYRLLPYTNYLLLIFSITTLVLTIISGASAAWIGLYAVLSICALINCALQLHKLYLKEWQFVIEIIILIMMLAAYLTSFVFYLMHAKFTDALFVSIFSTCVASVLSIVAGLATIQNKLPNVEP